MTTRQREEKPSNSNALRRMARTIGPGVVTGAADDDPAGIATHSIAGAQFGTGLLWLAPLTWPLMAGVQRWKDGMDERPSRARGFYGVFALSIGSAMLLEFSDFGAVRALYLSAIINGLLAPVLLAGILAVASDRRVMEGAPSPLLGRITVFVATVAMLGAAVGMVLL